MIAKILCAFFGHPLEPTNLVTHRRTCRRCGYTTAPPPPRPCTPLEDEKREHDFPDNCFWPCTVCGLYVEECIDLRYCPGPLTQEQRDRMRSTDDVLDF